MESSNQWFPVQPYTVGICPGNLVFLCILLNPSPTKPWNRAELNSPKSKKEKKIIIIINKKKKKRKNKQEKKKREK